MLGNRAATTLYMYNSLVGMVVYGTGMYSRVHLPGMVGGMYSRVHLPDMVGGV